LPEEKIEDSFLYQPLSDFAPMVFPYLHFDELKDRQDKEKKEKAGDEKMVWSSFMKRCKNFDRNYYICHQNARR
jgi:hypothetical protein